MYKSIINKLCVESIPSRPIFRILNLHYINNFKYMDTQYNLIDLFTIKILNWFVNRLGNYFTCSMFKTEPQ